MSCVNDTYTGITGPSEAVYKDRGSRFIAMAHPVESESQVKALVDEARKEYHDARHCCFAYRIGRDGALWRANDDGEPSGSAGRPILAQIDSAGLSDVLVIVVRYFGGIKLGVPGLIKAYKTSTADALAAADRLTKSSGSWVSVSFPYESLPDVMKLVKDLDLPQEERVFDVSCSMRLRVRDSLREEFLQRIKNISNFNCQFV